MMSCNRIFKGTTLYSNDHIKGNKVKKERESLVYTLLWSDLVCAQAYIICRSCTKAVPAGLVPDSPTRFSNAVFLMTMMFLLLSFFLFFGGNAPPLGDIVGRPACASKLSITCIKLANTPSTAFSLAPFLCVLCLHKARSDQSALPVWSPLTTYNMVSAIR